MRRSDLSVAAIYDGPRVTVSLAGAFTAATCKDVEPICRHVVRRPQLEEFLFDLRRLTSIDQAGVACIVDARDRCAERGARVTLDVGEAVRPALERAGLAS
ncbi:MAG TPA: STAS domain-containing protein [Gaiellales bacterium]|jgi:anti-anti-sigma regulatory factor|nr:STAS domain-containing protein [Gaiellales bacterium]